MNPTLALLLACALSLSCEAQGTTPCGDCKIGFYCSEKTKACEDLCPSYGRACKASNECDGNQCGSGICVEGTCFSAPLLADGQSCSDATGTPGICQECGCVTE